MDIELINYSLSGWGSTGSQNNSHIHNETGKNKWKLKAESCGLKFIKHSCCGFRHGICKKSNNNNNTQLAST